LISSSLTSGFSFVLSPFWNVFFWPTAVKDKCWYKQDQILAIIPEPKKIKGSSEHFEVDPDIWSKVLEKV
jgi:hypothetical protein